jgi:hypothetical protein
MNIFGRIQPQLILAESNPNTSLNISELAHHSIILFNLTIGVKEESNLIISDKPQ